jgi:hypothetical protein
MGLLDDAIKEHLELKRKRGADAEEVSRLEQEALGPPQRGEFAGATAPAQDAEPSEVADAPSEEAVAPEPVPETADHDIVEPEPEVEPSDRGAPEWLEDEEPLEEQPAEGEPVVLDQPTVEYASPAEPAPEGDDVLEETPDFLQETPEHDRLWFEQKPPRDFDLDR